LFNVGSAKIQAGNPAEEEEEDNPFQDDDE